MPPPHISPLAPVAVHQARGAGVGVRGSKDCSSSTVLNLILISQNDLIKVKFKTVLRNSRGKPDRPEWQHQPAREGARLDPPRLRRGPWSSPPGSRGSWPDSTAPGRRTVSRPRFPTTGVQCTPVVGNRGLVRSSSADGRSIQVTWIMDLQVHAHSPCTAGP